MIPAAAPVRTVISHGGIRLEPNTVSAPRAVSKNMKSEARSACKTG